MNKGGGTSSNLHKIPSAVHKSLTEATVSSRAAKGKQKEVEITMFTVNDSLQSQDTLDEEESSATTAMDEDQGEGRDTSPMEFIKVRKKKGGKKGKGCWNIRGLNGFQKQKNVSDWIQKNNLSMYSLVETKMHEINMKKWQHDMAMNKWQFFSNGSNTDTARIIVGWDKGVFDVVTVNISPQWVTCRVHSAVHGFDFTASFFYGHNTPIAKQEM
ncbi:hypothetical protein OIU85_014569 [Salix viminalis]|uniref:Uncharacterized protein n=1 Tax=Salix viminalis TaxID=40686 RepID=A0A9Q0NJE0_SALVM|nr:hypothetical protein OIU85_014569 [Salix viminalis]